MKKTMSDAQVTSSSNNITIADSSKFSYKNSSQNLSNDDKFSCLKKKILEISIIYLFYCWNNNCNCNYCNCTDNCFVFGKKKDDSNSPPIPSPIPPIPPPINEIKIYEETI